MFKAVLNRILSMMVKRVEWKYGNTEYFVFGRLHRTDGPAVIYANGNESWYYWGKLHREGGPAVIGSNGEERWYRHGQFHRTDGPAYIDSDGKAYWFVEGERIDCFHKFQRKTKSSEQTVAFMVLKYGGFR